MEFISSDTNVWLDFEWIGYLHLPFKLPYIYLMNDYAVHDELLSPPDLGSKLIQLGLVETEITEEEFYLAGEYTRRYRRLSLYDCIALAIAKCRNITLMTGDGFLRKSAMKEGVEVLGTIGILDQLFQGAYIDEVEYLNCLQKLYDHNGGKVRLPSEELEKRIKEFL